MYTKFEEKRDSFFLAHPLFSSSFTRFCRLVCFIIPGKYNISTSPFDTESLCIAGNWWLPVVSVIWSVQAALLDEMTFLYVSSMVGM